MTINKDTIDSLNNLFNTINNSIVLTIMAFVILMIIVGGVAYFFTKMVLSYKKEKRMEDIIDKNTIVITRNTTILEQFKELITSRK